MGLIPFAPFIHLQLGSAEVFLRNDGPFRPVMMEVLPFRKPDLASGQVILDLIFIINIVSAVDWILEDPPDSPGIPLTAKLCFRSIGIQGQADTPAAKSSLQV